MGLPCISLALHKTKLWAYILLSIMVQHWKAKPCLELWTLCIFFSYSAVSYNLLLKLLNFTILPRQSPKWDPALILSSLFLNGASPLKFSNFKNSGLTLWLMNGHEPCLLLFLQDFHPILFLTSNEMCMIFCSNATLSCWSSSTQPSKYSMQAAFQLPWSKSPRLPPLSSVSPAQRKRIVSRVPRITAYNFTIAGKEAPSTALCVCLCWNTTCFPALLILLAPTNLLIILVKQWDRTLIPWPTDLISYLC